MQRNWLRTNDIDTNTAEWTDGDIERILREAEKPDNWRVWDSMLISDERD